MMCKCDVKLVALLLFFKENEIISTTTFYVICNLDKFYNKNFELINKVFGDVKASAFRDRGLSSHCGYSYEDYVNDLPKVVGFFRVLRFPSTEKVDRLGWMISQHLRSVLPVYH